MNKPKVGIPTSHYLKDELYDVMKREDEIFEFLQSSATDGIWYWDIENPEHEWMNSKFWEVLGYNPDEKQHLSSEWKNIINPDDLKVALSNFEKHCEDPSHPYDQIVRYTHKNGSTVWVRCKGIAIRNAAGKAIRMLGAHTNITELKEKEELLERCNREGHIGFWSHNLKEGTTIWSSTTKEIFEVEDNFVVTYESGLSFYPEHQYRQIAASAVEKVIREKKTQTFTSKIITKKGNAKWVKNIIIPRIQNGVITSTYGTTQDVTSLVETELRLALSEQAFDDAFFNSPIAMALVDLNGRWMQFNNALPKMLGYSKKELEKLTFQEVTHPHDLQLDLNLLNELIEGKRTNYQLFKRYITKEGEIVHVNLSVSAVYHTTGNIKYFVSQVLDVTELIKKQEKIKTINANLIGILESSRQVAIITTDKNGTIKTYNAGAEELFGYKAEEIINIHSPAVFHLESEIEEKAQELFTKYKKELKGIEIFTYEATKLGISTSKWTYLRKDKKTFPAQVSVSKLITDKKTTGFLAVITDITLLVQAEEEARNLREVENLAEVAKEQVQRLNNFTHIVSHNLRSHTSNMELLLQFLEDEIQDIQSFETFNLLKKSAKSLSETILHLNEAAKIQRTVREDLHPVLLKPLIEKNINTIQAKADLENITLDVQCPAHIWVNAIEGYLDSIILNLLTNAIKYQDSNKQNKFINLRVSTSTNLVTIQIEDNGLGIDLEKDGDKLFKLYKTFHEHPDSRGVGLFITKGQIEAMGGTISVKSAVKEGSTFSVQLNQAKQPNL